MSLSPPGPTAVLPETEAVYWRPRADERRLGLLGRVWTLTTAAHVVPFFVAGGGLLALEPLTAPVGVLALVHAWIIPELYAQRGANVVRPPRPPRARRARRAGGSSPEAERISLGLLGDLIGHAARETHARTGLVPERGGFGTWLVGEAGALLVRPGGRRVHCWCVHAADPDLPAGDRVAHLLLALREDEAGFATVANLAFSGAVWRVRRRIPPPMRPALDDVVARSRRERVAA